MRSRLLALAATTVLVSTLLAACGGSDEPSAGTCSYRKVSQPGTAAKLPPKEPVSVTTLTIATNRGDIKATLLPDKAPCTVSSFASLAKQGFFDGTKCHRLIPGFVLQCGDPTATGTGGPGYQFDDELDGKEAYPAGTLAMANNGAGTNSNGSQFFITLPGADAQLDPDYTVFGSVDAAGLKIVEDIAAQGVGANGIAPAEDVVIQSVK